MASRTLREPHRGHSSLCRSDVKNDITEKDLALLLEMFLKKQMIRKYKIYCLWLGLLSEPPPKDVAYR